MLSHNCEQLPRSRGMSLVRINLGPIWFGGFRRVALCPAVMDVRSKATSRWGHPLPDGGYFTAVICRPIPPGPREMIFSGRRRAVGAVPERVCVLAESEGHRPGQINGGVVPRSCVTGCRKFHGDRLSTDPTGAPCDDFPRLPPRPGTAGHGGPRPLVVRPKPTAAGQSPALRRSVQSEPSVSARFPSGNKKPLINQGFLFGGLGRNRTGVRGFAIRCMTTLPPGR